MPDAPFWESKTLAEMSREEWEALCDGCARCCLHKLEDGDTGEIHYTTVACRLLDTSSCRCTDYANRCRLVPDCVSLSPERAGHLGWLPDTCAYRRLDEGRGLPSWHYLVCGDRDAVHRAGVSVTGWSISENEAGDDDLEQRIAGWIAPGQRTTPDFP